MFLLRIQQVAARVQRRRRVLQPTFELSWTIILRQMKVQPLQVIGPDEFLQVEGFSSRHLILFRRLAEALGLKADVLVRRNHTRAETVRLPPGTPLLLKSAAVSFKQAGILLRREFRKSALSEMMYEAILGDNGAYTASVQRGGQ